jgi:pyruvate,water dikinase
MNVSVMCSLLVSFGIKKEKAYKALKSLVGNVPEGVEIPVSAFDKTNFPSACIAVSPPK